MQAKQQFTTELQARINTKKKLLKFNNTHIHSRVYRRLLEDLIPAIPATTNICPPFTCNYGGNKIILGDQVYIDSNCIFLDGCGIVFGDRTQIGPNVQVYTSYDAMDSLKREDVAYRAPVTIGDDCWIGGGSIINAGVRIGNKCLIRAGSVISVDIPDNAVF